MNKKAFTLIELLVVIAIIALLLAIVTPSLMQAKEQARGVYCRHNLKQMCMAAASYAVNSDDYYPIAHYTKTVTQAVPAQAQAGPRGRTVFSSDDPQVETQTVTYSYVWDFTTVRTGSKIQTTPGLLWQGDTTEKVHQCPSYKGGNNWSGNPYTGYNYNTSYVGHGQGESVQSGYKGKVKVVDGQTIVMPVKTFSIKNLASCALFGDGHYTGGANKFMRAPMPWEGDADWTIRPGGTQGFRHDLRSNVGWADGHVTSVNEWFTETHPKYKLMLERYNETSKIKVGYIGPVNTLYDLK